MFSSNFGKPGAFGNTTTSITFGNTNGNTFKSNQTMFGKPTTFGVTPSTSTFGQPVNNSLMFPNLQPPGLFPSGTTPTFNATAAPQTSFGTTSLFGQQTANQTQPQPSTSGLFGNAFGANKPFGFGVAPNQTAPTTGLFGQQTNQVAAGAAAPSLFQPTANTSNLFGAAGGAGGVQAATPGAGTAFGTPNAQQLGTPVKFTPLTGSDTMQKNGVAQSICTKHHCITCMKEYEAKSLEELRYEDYGLNRKGQQAGFGVQTFGGGGTLFDKPATGAFGAANTSTFGQTGAVGGANTSTFGMTSTPNLFGKTAGFGTTNTTTFGFNTASTANPFSGNAAKPFGQSLFTTGATPATTATTAAGVGTTAFGGGVPNATGSVFGQNTTGSLFAKPTFPTTQTGFSLGANQAGTAFQTPKTNTGFGMFGQTTTTATTAATAAFGFGGPNSNTTFGKVAPTFGQPVGNTTGFGMQNVSLFGNANDNKGIGTLGTGTSLFGNTSTGTGGGLFGGGAGGLGTFQTTPSFGLQTQNPSQQLLQPQQPAQQATILQFPPAPSEEVKNMQLIASDITTDGPHLYGLTPILKRNDTGTNPRELKHLLDDSKNTVAANEKPTYFSPKIRVTSPKVKHTPKKDLFTPDSNKSNTMIVSRKCLIIKKTDDNINPSVFNRFDGELLREAEKCLKNDNTFNDRSISSISDTLDGADDNTSQNVQTEMVNTSIINDNSLTASQMAPSAMVDQPITPPAGTETTNPCGVVLTRPEYYMHPPLKDLEHYVDENGDCIIQGLTIGRYGYGNVHFMDPINIAGMNLDEIIHFRHREINVYPDESVKPPIGQGLNRRAQVTLDKIYPRDKETNNYVTDVDEIIKSNFLDKLILVTEKHDTKFVDYRPKTGSWVFKVKHFSKFGFTDSDEEYCRISANQDGLMEQNRPITETDTVPPTIDMAEEEEEEEEQGGGDLDLHVGLGGKDSTRFQASHDHDDEFQWINDKLYMNDEDNAIFHTKTNSSIQAMKMALFAPPKTASTIEKTSDIYEKTQEPIVMEMDGLIDDSDIFNPIVTIEPKIFPIPELSADTYTRVRLHCYTDLGIFRGDAFKTTFPQNFLYFQVERFYDHRIIHDLTTNHIAHTSSNMINLIGALENVLDSSDFSFDDEGIPTLKIRKNQSYLDKQTSLFEETMNTDGDSRYLASVWQLCTALWADDYSPYGRRQRVSDWLQRFVQAPPRFGRNQSPIVQLFDLLTLYKVDESAQLATENNLDYLSLLISEVSLTERSKSFLKQYTENLAQMPTDFIRIYLLLAGITLWGDVNIFDEIDWLRCFGIHLWYITPAATPLDVVMNEYQKSFMEFKCCTTPVPPYEPSDHLDDNYDLLYHILMLYTKTSYYPLVQLLNPPTHTANPIDYRLSWLLLQLFQSLDVGQIDKNQSDYIATNLASQLEDLGEWKWSIFVLIYLNDNRMKKLLIKRILERNLDELQSTNQIESELCNLFKIPTDWIHEIKAEKNQLTKNYYQSFIHYVHRGDWSNANQLLINHIMSHLFINDMSTILSKLINMIVDGVTCNAIKWNEQINLMIDFIQLENVLIENFDDENELMPIKICLNSICQRLNYFSLDLDEQKLCLAELSKKCANLYRIIYEKNNPKFAEQFVDFIDGLIMPADYKYHELLYLIGNLICN